MRRWTMAGLAAVLLLGGSARALEAMAGDGRQVDVKVADDVWRADGHFSGIDYGTSDRLGRAWLILHYESQGPCRDTDGDCRMDAPVQVNVPGLGYEAAERQVVYRGAGAEPVVCAAVRDGGFLRGEALVSTGRCTYRIVKVDRIVDDGFAGRKDRREEVHFAVTR